MKLTDREVEIVSSYSTVKNRRKIGAWLGLATVVAFWIGQYYFDRLDSLGPVIAVFLGISAAELASLYFRVRPEDKMVDLLQRYINSDAEALAQFSSRHDPDEIAA